MIRAGDRVSRAMVEQTMAGMSLGAGGREEELDGNCERAGRGANEAGNHPEMLGETRGACQTRRCAPNPRVSGEPERDQPQMNADGRRYRTEDTVLALSTTCR